MVPMATISTEAGGRAGGEKWMNRAAVAVFWSRGGSERSGRKDLHPGRQLYRKRSDSGTRIERHRDSSDIRDIAIRQLESRNRVGPMLLGDELINVESPHRPRYEHDPLGEICAFVEGLELRRSLRESPHHDSVWVRRCHGASSLPRSAHRLRLGSRIPITVSHGLRF